LRSEAPAPVIFSCLVPELHYCICGGRGTSHHEGTDQANKEKSKEEGSQDGKMIMDDD